MLDWLTPVLTFAGVLVAGGMTVWGNVIVSRRKAKSDDVSASAAVQEAINEGFLALNAGYQAQMAEANEQTTALRGEIRELVQHIESLETILRDLGVPIPMRRHRHAQRERLALVPPHG